MIFIDSNIVIDVLERDDRWYEWSREQIANAARKDGIAASSIVAAECAARFGSLAELVATFDALGILVEDLPLDAAFSAGRLFRMHRRATSDRGRVLADFLIGAHAAGSGDALMTRDTRLYRTYFPELPLITPETHPHG